MKLQVFTTTALLWTDTVSADFLSAKSLHTGNNVDLGHLEDIAHFYSVIGHNGTGWEDVTEQEVFEVNGKLQNSSSMNPALPAAIDLIKREDYCKDETGITRMVCEHMPSRWWFWGAGGGLAIYYAPGHLANWLDETARAIRAGRNLRNVYYNQQGHDELKRRSGVNATASIPANDYHFSLPYLLDHEGKPDTSSIKRRNNNQDGTDANFKHDYVYSEGDGLIYYKASSLTFSPGPMQSNSTNTLQARGRTSDYTINMIISKHSKANTIASPKCISQLLKYHLDASSEKGRFSCRPLDNTGSWRATMHLMINKGKNNRGTYGKCCD